MQDQTKPKQPARKTVKAIRADDSKTSLLRIITRLEGADKGDSTAQLAQLISTAAADYENFKTDIRVLNNVLLRHETSIAGVKGWQSYMLDPLKNITRHMQKEQGKKGIAPQDGILRKMNGLGVQWGRISKTQKNRLQKEDEELKQAAAAYAKKKKTIVAKVQKSTAAKTQDVAMGDAEADDKAKDEEEIS